MPYKERTKIHAGHFVELFLEISIPICELIGISIVAISAGTAFFQYAKSWISPVPCNVKFQLANGLTLSLEIKMVAEILKNRVHLPAQAEDIQGSE